MLEKNDFIDSASLDKKQVSKVIIEKDGQYHRYWVYENPTKLTIAKHRWQFVELPILEPTADGYNIIRNFFVPSKLVVLVSGLPKHVLEEGAIPLNFSGGPDYNQLVLSKDPKLRKMAAEFGREKDLAILINDEDPEVRAIAIKQSERKGPEEKNETINFN